MNPIKDVLSQTVAKYAQKPAIIFAEHKIPFVALEANTLKFANALSKLGLNKGDKLAINLPNRPEFCFAYLANFYLGAVGVPLDFMLKSDELISCLTHSEAKILIIQNRKNIDLAAIKSAVPTLEEIIVVDEAVEDTLSFRELISQEDTSFDAVDVADSDPSLLMYTSGTTGKPKGIVLNYKHLEGSPLAMRHFTDLTDQDTKLAAIPLSHIGGFIYLQNCIHFGITTVLMPRFNPFEFLQLVAEHKVTCFHIVPPMYNAILTLKEIEKFDLSSLRWVVVFGAPSSPEIMERFHKYCPNAKLLNGWGMTETCPPNTVTPMDSDNIASIGKPAPHCKISIVDDAGQEVPTGEIGEIVISGWVIMDEYYKDPEETARVKKDGCLWTGDLGRVDSEGYFYIVGRKKEMIKVGGQIVYAPEVESALYKCEEVSECAVIGIPDEMKGEAVKAFVVLKEGSQFEDRDVRYFAREHLANFKVPSSIEIRDSLPKNRTGKIDKNLLKNEILT